jgi:hypothetical protein
MEAWQRSAGTGKSWIDPNGECLDKNKFLRKHGLFGLGA